MSNLPEDPTPQKVHRSRRRNGHADGWYVSAKDYDQALAARDAEIAAKEATLDLARSVIAEFKEEKLKIAEANARLHAELTSALARVGEAEKLLTIYIDGESTYDTNCVARAFLTSKDAT